MLVAPRYGAIDLPIYGPDTPVVYHAQLSLIHETPGNDLVRHTGIKALGFTSLADILRETDTEAERLAELCGAKLIEHSWGLYDYPEEEAVHVSDLEIPNVTDFPDGYLLVAKVELIEPTPTTVLSRAQLNAQIDVGRKEYKAIKPRKPILFDIRSLDDFAFGTARRELKGHQESEPAPTPVLHLTDIEPRFRIPQQ